MKVLMICHTYLMLMSAIQVKRYELPNDNVDIILTDFSTNMENVSKRLNALKIYNNVYFCRIKNIYHGGDLVHKIKKTLLIFEKKSKVIKKFHIQTLNYDVFMMSNFDIPATQLYVLLKRSNPQLQVWRFEEGYSTYLYENDYLILEKIFKMVHFFLGVPEFVKAVRKIYLYEPLYLQYNVPYEKKRLKKFSKSKKDKELLNSVFGYNNEAAEYEKYKYIIFEESFWVDKKENINDFQIFSSIVEKVGNQNVILKMHPRSERNRFEGMNIGDSSIPWEVIQMNGNFNNSFFITITSGSVLGSKLWLEDDVKTIFLYKCTNRKPRVVKKQYSKYLKLLYDGNVRCFFPKNIDELLDILVEK